MALLQYPAPVDYATQQEAFKDFLKHFKSFESASEASATEAIEDLHIDGDRTSDEYDFMDDADEGLGRTARRRRDPKQKYMQMLQDVANRDRNNILIELDDLQTVSPVRMYGRDQRLTCMCTVREIASRRYRPQAC
jgi:DNA replication licensing factor MCM7